MLKDKIKLIIWDMDETFWNGTISEGQVYIPESRIGLIKELVDRGIMNSISSKNDYKVVKAKLEEIGIWDLFIFPHINWDNKGVQIKDIVNECKLRPVNCVFIDDNLHNLNEAKHACDGIQTATPDIIDELLNCKYLKGNEDKEHNRLKQFKILEQKVAVRQRYDSNEAFLYESDIQAAIGYDCEKYKDRLIDLINRTNQLNFTKKRVTKAEFDDLLKDTGAIKGYVRVADKFGDYGIVGFFLIKDNTAEHFLFSCRTIGLGIEQWTYAELGHPKLTVVGEVIHFVDNSDKPAWISNQGGQEKVSEKISLNKNKKILIKGGCDLKQLEPYIKSKQLKTEFNYLKYHRDHTVFVLDALNMQENRKKEFISKIPFLYEKSFETEMFHDDNDIVVYSLLMDYAQPVYEYNKNKNIRLAWGNIDKPLIPENTGEFNPSDVEWFFENFTLTGVISPRLFRENLERIRRKIPSETALILINGCEIPHENEKEPDRYKIHRLMNSVVDDFVRENRNVYLLDMRKIIFSREDLDDNIRHYKRKIYYEMAKELVSLMNDIGSANISVSKRNMKALLQNTKKSVKAIWKGKLK